ncbi:hypothetical protein AAVH_13728, partial [Aphelenchoides avenae]
QCMQPHCIIAIFICAGFLVYVITSRMDPHDAGIVTGELVAYHSMTKWNNSADRHEAAKGKKHKEAPFSGIEKTHIAVLSATYFKHKVE